MRMWDEETLLCFLYLSSSPLSLSFPLSLSVRVCVFDFVDVAASIKGPTLPSTVRNWKLKLKCDESNVEPLY